MATAVVPENATPAENPRRRWRLVCRPVVEGLCIAGALVHPVASLLSRYDWLADLLTHFQGPALGATALAVAATVRGRRWLALVLAGLAVSQVGPLVRYSGSNPVPPDPNAPERLRVLVVNVLHDNRQVEDLAQLIRAEAPDVIGIIEYSPEGRAALAEVRAAYPYRQEFAKGASGIALWSRMAPRSLDPPEWLNGRGNCVLHATFDFAGAVRHVWVVHPVSPLYRLGERGNPDLTALARRVRETGGSRIVMGDMNSTDGSTHFRDFLRETGLRDSRHGFGRQPSWPTEFPYRIAIDHVFVSADLAVTDRRLGPKVGSDHFPVLFTLAPAATNPVAHVSQSSRSSP